MAENQTTTYVTADSNPFNFIKFNEPTVSVSIGNESNVWNNTNCKADLNFISVDSTISSGISTTSCIAIEKLQKLLIDRKDDIDHVLESQPIYAIGIDFQKDSIRPCIVCWVAKPLGISILECLETMFENEFKAIYQIIDINESNNNLNPSESSSSSDYIIEEFSNIKSTDHHFLNNENLKKENNEEESEKKKEKGNGNGNDI